MRAPVLALLSLYLIIPHSFGSRFLSVSKLMAFALDGKELSLGQVQEIKSPRKDNGSSITVPASGFRQFFVNGVAITVFIISGF